jgi:hypothetical protein
MSPTPPFEFSNRAQAKYSCNFASEYVSSQWNANLGTDAIVSVDGEGILIDSSSFKSSAFGNRGSLDHFKGVLGKNEIFQLPRPSEMIFEASLAVKQVFPSGPDPFPAKYKSRVLNMKADPRLSNGGMHVIDPTTGWFACILLTDDAVFAGTGVDPNLIVCDTIVESDKCEPCVALRGRRYTCNDYLSDPAWANFKSNLSYENFSRFMRFQQWYNWCQANNNKVLDWQLFGQFNQQYPEDCDRYCEKDYQVWQSMNSFDEYKTIGLWPTWLSGWKEFYACSLGNGLVGGCVQKLFGSNGCSVCGGGAAARCFHAITEGEGANCYMNGDRKPDGVHGSNALRSCCSPLAASFYDLKRIHTRENCDPLCAPILCAIGVSRNSSTVKFYISRQEVHRHVGLGVRGPSSCRSINGPGYSKSLDVAQLVAYIGTGSIVDGALPDNVARQRTAEGLAYSALTPTMPVDRYFEPEKNSHGALVSYNSLAGGSFAVPTQGREWRTWGQGAILKCGNFSVLQRYAETDYKPSLNYWKSSCCGQRDCSTQATDGCTPNFCDTRELNFDIFDLFDPDQLDVVFSNSANRFGPVGDDHGIFDPANPSSCGKRRRDDEHCVTAKVVRRDGVGESRFCASDDTFVPVSASSR